MCYCGAHSEKPTDITTCFTMRLLLLVCVQTILMASGNCLQCITCAVINKMTPIDCNGPSLQCGVNQVCLTFNLIITQNQGSVRVRTEEYYIRKQCLDYKHCEQSGKTSSPTYRRTFSTSCCSTDNCLSLPALPPQNNTHNGLVCPATSIYAETKYEPTYAMKCIGEETYCYENIIDRAPKQYIAGCASYSYFNVIPLMNVAYHLDPDPVFVKLSWKKANTTSSLPVVNRLRCPTCQTATTTEGPDCMGQSLQCGEDQACLTLYMSIFSTEDSIFSRNMMYFVGRQCWYKNQCDRVGKVSSASHKILLSTNCCFSDDCLMPIPPLPLESNTHNGLVCPAHGTFMEKKNILTYAIKCTAYEDFCFLYTTVKKPQVYTIGCASVAYCDLINLINEYYYYTPNSPYGYDSRCVRAHISSSLAVVNTLLCWHCRGSVDFKCEMFAKCSAENDACVTIISKTSYGGKTEMQLFKRCGFSSECNKAGIITTTQKSISRNTTCCYTDHCISPIPTLLPESNETNGLVCESCYLEDSDSCSSKDRIACTGNATQCISYTEKIVKGINTSSEIFRGCAHPSICDSGNINVTYHQTTFEETKTCGVPAKSSKHPPNILYASVMFVIWSYSI